MSKRPADGSTITLSIASLESHPDQVAIYGTVGDDHDLFESAKDDGEWFEIDLRTLTFLGEFYENAFLACVHAMSEPRARMPKHRISAQRTRRHTLATTGSR